MNKKPPEIKIIFEPTPNFKEEFSAFVEEILEGEEENEETKNNNNKQIRQIPAL